jgi:hypothetical protein
MAPGTSPSLESARTFGLYLLLAAAVVIRGGQYCLVQPPPTVNIRRQL